MEHPTQATLGRLLGPAKLEVACDECFEQLDRYVELEFAGVGRRRRVPGSGRISMGAPPAARSTTACVALVLDDRTD